jgi:hypothetical protein
MGGRDEGLSYRTQPERIRNPWTRRMDLFFQGPKAGLGLQKGYPRAQKLPAQAFWGRKACSRTLLLLLAGLFLAD